MEEQFQDIREEMATKKDLADFRQEMKEDMAGFKMQMVTKPYLDNHLADVRGENVLLVRKEDAKVNAVVNVLADEDIINPPKKQEILALGPFRAPV
jgi:hypothetical protein